MQRVSQRLSLVPLVAAFALAGCFGGPGATQSSTTSQGGGSGAAWGLDCTLGDFERANGTWAQDCVARASHSEGSKTEMWVGVNPTDPANVIVAAKDLDPENSPGCVWNGLFVTHDAGAHWKEVVIGGKFADRKPGDATYGYRCNTDPDFRFSKDGAVHYGVEMYGVCLPPAPVCQNDPGYKILLATSHDGGDTWPDIVTYQPDILVTTDFSRMTIVPTTQTILEAIGSYGGVGCNLLSSRDGGKSADPPVPVATKDGVPCGSGGDTAIAGSPAGVAVIVGGISTAAATGNAPVVVRSADDGRTWTDSNVGFEYTPIPGRFSESQYRTPGTVELAYDLTNGTRAGTLYACFPAGDRAGDEADIFVRASHDDGRTWDEAVRVNDDAAGPHQWMCNIAVAADGSLQAFFMDKRYDPEHKLIDITHAWSTDGGQNWTNERVTTVSFDGDLGRHQDGFPFIGDYLGVDCAGMDCWAGFPDTSPGKTAVAAAAHVHLG